MTIEKSTRIKQIAIALGIMTWAGVGHAQTPSCSAASTTLNCSLSGTFSQSVSQSVSMPEYSSLVFTNSANTPGYISTTRLPEINVLLDISGLGVPQVYNGAGYNGAGFLAAPSITFTNESSTILSPVISGSASASGAVIRVQSLGAKGIIGGSTGFGEDFPHNQYQGRNGGPVSVSISGHMNPEMIWDGSSALPGLGGVTVPFSAVVWAASLGGNGASNTSHGGNGGNGGPVTMTTDSQSTILVSGDNIAGLYALSGGGQGAGGDIAYWGGNADNVTVTHAGTMNLVTSLTADVSTYNGGVGIYALSAGGYSNAWVDHQSRGGNAGTVNVELVSGSAIQVYGTNGSGVFAGSIGGLAWYADTKSQYNSQNGNGGQVNVTLDAGSQVLTQGELNVGVAAISSGGNSSLTQVPPGNNAPATLTASGAAGNVQVTANGAIETHGDVSMGIAAISSTGGRSIGPIQGDSIDQVGAGSGAPGTVTVNNAGSIITANLNATSGSTTVTQNGDGSTGILALSVGGPGGVLNTHTGLLQVLGGGTSGSDGVSGSSVQVTNSGSIQTSGNSAMGILAQSVGGGGGTATGSGGIVSVGGNGGAGGNGGNVSVILSGGTISTQGDGSYAVLTQSIGGGGGNGANTHGLIASVGGSGASAGNGGPLLFATGGDAITTTTGDYAPAIGLQSIGGGGGSGGYAKAFGAVAAAVGGQGGAGGNGGDIQVCGLSGNNALCTTSSSIQTTGDQSPGMLIQSVGGGGGQGGAANAHSAGLVFSASIALGGTGGDGGAGGTVTVQNTAGIQTSGVDSIGLLAQSVGGGGGQGGGTFAKAIAANGTEIPVTASISVAVGGSGGSGGAGGAVSVTNDTNITTTGNGSFAVLAQSIGGGGGNGGDSTAASTVVQGEGANLAASAAVGGHGGSGGVANTVAIDNFATVVTTGTQAAALVAQSIGGGGGTGAIGNASSGSPLVGNDEDAASVNIGIGIGGSGGTGGDGGTTIVGSHKSGQITTTGSGAQGIVAQSIGGGGGLAGGGVAGGAGDNVNINVSVGGSGGSGGNGGAVTVQNLSQITTGVVVQGSNGSFVAGGDAVGIVAQSIGGGGGIGGSSDAAAPIGHVAQAYTAKDDASNQVEANVSIGGNGSKAGNGGAVTVTNGGQISTLGIRAHGILAQSIGGGGGTGGAAAAQANFGGPSVSTYAANVAVSGQGGAGGNGGAVAVTNTASIATAGYGAVGILGQSVGGGGGYGAQGSINTNVTVSLGFVDAGNGGHGGNGAAASVTNHGAVSTRGDDAPAILVGSIGGGGGAASSGCTNSVYAGAASGVGASACLGNPEVGGGIALKPWVDSTAVTVNVGGRTGTSGDGSSAQVETDSMIQTTGSRSIGIVAQSIGGGGGYFSGALANTAAVNVQNGSAGSIAANGGAVTVTVDPTGQIVTSGAGAWGILAQSIGGGGGFAADSSLPLALPQSNLLTTSQAAVLGSGQVQVTVNGSITTTGANAHGVVAQSVASGGGIATSVQNSAVLMGNGNAIGATYDSSVGTNPRQAGGVEVDQGAGSVISATGTGSIGIVAQSSGVLSSANKYAAQPIVINIAGTVIGGTQQGYGHFGVNAAGIVLSGGSNATDTAAAGNTITVMASGIVTTSDGASGNAIIAAYGLTNVTNQGVITGSINLGTTPGSITNSGTLNSGSSLVASNLTNAGTLNVFGNRRIGVTTITGDLVQTSQGTLAVDIDALGPRKADQVNVSGSASLSGNVVPLATNLLSGSYTVLQAGTLASTAAAPSTPVFTWSLAHAGNTLTITPNAHFVPAAATLPDSHLSLANYLTTSWNQSDPTLAPTFGGLSRLTTVSQYNAALETLSARGTQAAGSSLLDMSGSMLGAGMSCPVFVGETALLGEDSCVWVRTTGQWSSRWDDNTPSYHSSSAVFRIGGQRQVAPHWFVGGTLATGTIWAAQNASTSQGQIFDGSAVVKYVDGPWYLAGSLLLAGGGFTSNRVVINSVSGSAVLRGNPSVLMGGSRLRAAYEVSAGNWYVRPYGDLDITYANMPGFQESGPAGLALDVRNSSHTNVAISPMVEFGGRYDTVQSAIVRLYGALGVSYLPTNTRGVEASFVGASASAGTFRTYMHTASVVGNAEVGVQLYRVDGFEARLEYGLHAGGSFLSQSASGRVAYHF